MLLIPLHVKTDTTASQRDALRSSRFDETTQGIQATFKQSRFLRCNEAPHLKVSEGLYLFYRALRQT